MSLPPLPPTHTHTRCAPPPPHDCAEQLQLAHRRIGELEAQNDLLRLKLKLAARNADLLNDELARLRCQSSAHNSSAHTLTQAIAAAATAAHTERMREEEERERADESLFLIRVPAMPSPIYPSSPLSPVRVCEGEEGEGERESDAMSVVVDDARELFVVSERERQRETHAESERETETEIERLVVAKSESLSDREGEGERDESMYIDTQSPQGEHSLLLSPASDTQSHTQSHIEQDTQQTQPQTQEQPQPRTPPRDRERDAQRDESLFFTPGDAAHSPSVVVQLRSQVQELHTALVNLKMGFQKREEKLQDKLENHRQALYVMHYSYEKLHKKLKDVCQALCIQLDLTEEYVQKRGAQTAQMKDRERDVFSLLKELRDLEKHQNALTTIFSRRAESEVERALKERAVSATSTPNNKTDGRNNGKFSVLKSGLKSGRNSAQKSGKVRRNGNDEVTDDIGGKSVAVGLSSREREREEEEREREIQAVLEASLAALDDDSESEKQEETLIDRQQENAREDEMEVETERDGERLAHSSTEAHTGDAVTQTERDTEREEALVRKENDACLIAATHEIHNTLLARLTALQESERESESAALREKESLEAAHRLAREREKQRERERSIAAKRAALREKERKRKEEELKKEKEEEALRKKEQEQTKSDDIFAEFSFLQQLGIDGESDGEREGTEGKSDSKRGSGKVDISYDGPLRQEFEEMQRLLDAHVAREEEAAQRQKESERARRKERERRRRSGVVSVQDIMQEREEEMDKHEEREIEIEGDTTFDLEREIDAQREQEALEAMAKEKEKEREIERQREREREIRAQIEREAQRVLREERERFAMIERERNFEQQQQQQQTIAVLNTLEEELHRREQRLLEQDEQLRACVKEHETLRARFLEAKSENLRLRAQAEELEKKQNVLQSEKQSLSRELSLYQTKIFSAIHSEGYGLNSLPDIALSFKANGADHSLVSSSAAQTVYIVKQLVENNDSLLSRVDLLEKENTLHSEQLLALRDQNGLLTQDVMRLEAQNAQLKVLVAQASRTISHTEEDYIIMQKQVELLNNKMEVLMIENKRLLREKEAVVNAVAHSPVKVPSPASPRPPVQRTPQPQPQSKQQFHRVSPQKKI